jgi:hypothetical protein
VAPTLEQFRGLRGDFTQLIEEEPRLTEKERKSALKFLGEFYEDLESDKDVQKLLIDKCRG